MEENPANVSPSAKTGSPVEPRPETQTAARERLKANRTKASELVDALKRDSGSWLRTPVLPDPVDRKVIVVLGMHRSGTSLCTRLLNSLGVELGAPLMAPNRYNPDGYQEHMAIFECHEALLQTRGARWDTFWTVRARSDATLQGVPAWEIRDRLKGIVTEQLASAGGQWAFKDPRTLRFLPLWKGIFTELGLEPIWLLTVRDPRAVSASLLERDKLPAALGELLWIEHYLEALRHLGPGIAGIFHYEKWFSSPSGQIEHLARLVGGVSADAIDAAARSIKPELRHYDSQAGDFELELTEQMFAWLSAESPDLDLLEGRAEAVWRGIAGSCVE